MIQTKILFIEQDVERNSPENSELLVAVRSIKKLLNQIDFQAEVVPLESTKKLSNLLESLKNEPLSNSERLLVKKLVKFK
ncbi:hypothetical protein [Xanthomarina sp. GH4-25]|uniref:hypothetical protein n=1 Tax=Xanthomarina sp. GH4-25 TaxID=3349335 RepID=UPI000D67D09B|nr:hypothetical protein DI383_01200 [Flavobacteriaceae bacterium LYZ1037]